MGAGLSVLQQVLITNGSRLARPEVRRGIETLARLGGEVWFKLDAVGAARALVNDAQLPDDRVAENLARCARVCPTRLQICLFARDGEPPAEGDLARLLAFIRSSLDAGVELRDALLYTIARQPLQPEGPRLSALAPQYLEEFARRLRSCGLATSVSA